MAKATSNLSVSDDSLAADVNKKQKRSCECTCLSPIDRFGLEISADEELVQCQCRECGLVDERTKVRRCNAKVIRETRAAFGPLCDECKDYHGSVPLILLFRAARKACDRERNRSTGAFPIWALIIAICVVLLLCRRGSSCQSYTRAIAPLYHTVSHRAVEYVEKDII